MSLGKEKIRLNRYYYSNLGNNFTIIISNNKYKVFAKDTVGCLILLSEILFNTLDDAKNFLVNWINKNMPVTYPNLSI